MKTFQKSRRLLACLLTVALLLTGSLPLVPVADAAGAVESIEVADLTRIENWNGYWDGCWDEETEEWVEDTWYYYDTFPDAITVHFKDGTSLTGAQWEIAEATGEWFSVTDDQSPDNPWGLGDHTAAVSLMGASVDYTVHVVESPVERIEVEELTLIKNIDGYFDEKEYDDWFVYEDAPKVITVYFKDGASLTGSPYEIGQATGAWVRVSDDQSPDNPWGLGEHTATAEFMGVSANYTVYVEESPVESIEAADLTLIENWDGWLFGHIDEESGDWVDSEHFCYDISPAVLTVRLKDGSSFTGSPYEIREAVGEWILVDSDQSEENPWGLGDHTAAVSLMGVSATFTVHVVESPVERIEVKELTLIENWDGYLDGFWNEETDEWVEGTWYHYDANPDTVAVYFKDGTSLTGSQWEIEQAVGAWVRVSDDQSPDNPWGLGEHTATANLMGASAAFTVRVAKNPVVGIEVRRAPDKTTYWAGECPNLQGAVIRLNLADGTHEDCSLDGVIADINFNIVQCNIDSINKRTSPSVYQQVLTVEDTEITLSVLGYTCAFPVTVIPNTTSQITVREDGATLWLSLHHADGTITEARVQDFDVRGGGEMGDTQYLSGYLLTDQGTYPIELNTTEDGSVRLVLSNATTGKTLESNVLENSSWLRLWQTAQAAAFEYVGEMYRKPLSITPAADGGYTVKATAANGEDWVITLDDTLDTTDAYFQSANTPGDVNGDGAVDTTDARLTLQYAAKRIKAEKLDLAAADVNGDSTVDTTDARLILQYAAKRIKDFPSSTQP